uniref:Uncharacterized protein n=1 Tax=Timema monikensis TaxID=170555 RepID=A0A7R9EM65_9NEOP|nr:unnamed protein product [Timema monikensis]
MEQGNTPPSFQVKDPARSLRNSLPNPSRKRKRRTDVEELESAVKLFQGIQQDNSSIKEMAIAVNRLSSAQEKLLVQQQSYATTLQAAIAAQLESNKLQQAHNIKISELLAFLLDQRVAIYISSINVMHGKYIILKRLTSNI